MDESSQVVVAFLEGVQAVREELQGVWNHYTRRGFKLSKFPGFGPAWASLGTSTSASRSLGRMGVTTNYLPASGGRRTSG